MLIKFTNRFRKEKRARYENALRYYLKKLGMTEQELEDVEVSLFLRKSEDRGCCQYDLGVRRPRQFEIIISPGGPYSPLQVLAHEAVHLKQFIRGELLLFSKCCKWKGRVWKQGETELDSYYDSTWEIEAYGKEEGLYVRFLVEEQNG